MKLGIGGSAASWLAIASVVAAGSCGISRDEQDTACPDAEERLGHRVCVHSIPDASTWTGISFEAAAVDQTRATTYLAPARSDARLPALFVDATAFESPQQSLHHKFLTESFPEFELLEYEEYLELVLDADHREWFAGSISEYLRPDAEPVFGFTVWDLGTDPDETVSCDQFRSVHDDIDERVAAGPVAVVPANDLQRATLEGCDVPVHDPDLAVEYELYTAALGCGTLRRFTLSELAAAEAEAAFGWQDVLVVEEAPLDIETVISGIVTGSRQGELSHLNVRSAARGTPNCYVQDAHALFEPWEGELVRLECGPSGATIEAITPEQAEECWEGLKPDPVDVVELDLEWTELVPLLQLPTDTAEDRRQGVGRFGSKGTNLATLYQRIDPDLQLEGFLVPFHYYDAFMNTGTWQVDLGQGLESASFQQTIAAWLVDAAFTTDGAVRRERLLAMQAAMESSACDPDLLDALGQQILTTYGGDDVMVRFRSSSNAEDALGFNGAGLYDSTSACLADQTDDDALGPSACDPDKANERDLCRGLRRVWASVWNMKAYEEREWYGIDHLSVAMGILVNTRTKNEQANIVAFTGNPLLDGDPRYLVNAQLGELDVVAAVAGVWPEKSLLTMEDDEVVLIERSKGSTELPEGEWVLSDDQLEQLGAHLSTIDDVYPVDGEIPRNVDVLLDTEWKLRSDGRLAIKQVRPFLD